MNVALHYLPSSAAEANRVAARLGVPAHEMSIHRFPDGELRLSVWPASAVSIVFASLDQPNEKLLCVLFAAESLRRNGSSRLVLVAPYLCYMRQDTAFHPGEAISQKVIGQLLSDRFDRVITVDAHLHRIKTLSDIFPRIESDNLSAMSAIASHLRQSAIDPDTVIVGPDSESRPWVSELAASLGLKFTVGRKDRTGDRAVEVTLDDSSALKGRPALLVDDIVSSGGTILSCARALVAAGVTSVDAVITHALFPRQLMDDFTRADIRTVRSTTAVPHFTNAIVLDQPLADALRPELVAAPNTEKSS
jgi:ribose-phosphate pyrophosphokinase